MLRSLRLLHNCQLTVLVYAPPAPHGERISPGRRSAGARNLVLPKIRAVIFINGCFWHGHRGCNKYVEPKTNAGFWKEKIARNIARIEADLRAAKDK